MVQAKEMPEVPKESFGNGIRRTLNSNEQRQNISRIRENQPELVPLPAAMPLARVEILELQAKFKAMAEGIGSTVHLMNLPQ
ncbi:hypothetical protein CS542_08490 [Pedobacter sp. IW39]|nr:hypothetical protein CS542_08490 [Pedobacter sp. IW39]